MFQVMIPSFTVKEEDENVKIHLVVQDTKAEKKIELTRKISYVNVEGEE